MPIDPPRRGNVATLVSDFRKNGSGIAVVVRQGLRRRVVSYAELADLTGRFAAYLSELKIQKGDRVVIWAPNGPEWMAAFFGCILRGVLPVPLDVTGSLLFAKRVIQETTPRMVVCSAASVADLQLSSDLALAIEQFEQALPREPLFDTAALSPDDPLQIIFTSGTTGEPKGIVHTHGNVLASLTPIEHEIGAYRKYERIFHPLRFLHTLPLSHVFGQFMGLWIPALIAAEVHFEDRLIASDLVKMIHSNRISVIAAVPRVLDLLREYVCRRFPDVEERRQKAKGVKPWTRWWIFRDIHRTFGFKFWSLVCGGAALPADLEEFWNSLGFVVVQGYGMTETTALVSLNHPFRRAQGSLGQVLPGREIRVTEDGEILVKGDTVSQLVWQEGGARKRDSEWLATGDLAELDAAGNLRFRGRKKDVIVTAAGLNIYPEDLEAALLAQPEVKSCAVIEVAGHNGPEPYAVLILREGDGKKSVASANALLSEFQRIHRWSIWPEPDLPRTATGKVLKREITAAITGREAPAATRGSVSALLAQLGNGAGSSEDLGLDSLARVELQASIEEQYGVAVDDSVMQTLRTVSDLQAALKSPAAPAAGETERPPDRRHWYPDWPWHPVQQCIRALFLELVAFPLVYVLAGPTVVSAPDAPKNGPLLLFANHVTAVDVPLILYCLAGRIRRRTAVAMSGEILLAWRAGRYYRYRFLNWISPLEYWVVTALFNVFPLPQRSGFRESFAHAAKAMDRGYSILVFPEGTRSSEGTIAKFMSGAGLLWQDLRCPALPIYLGGLGELKSTRSRWFRCGKLRFHVGSPIAYPSEKKPESLVGLLEEALRELQKKSAAED